MTILGRRLYGKTTERNVDSPEIRQFEKISLGASVADSTRISIHGVGGSFLKGVAGITTFCHFNVQEVCKFSSK